MRKAGIPLLLAVMAATPAAAAQTEWQEVSPGVRLRMISDDVLNADGTTRLGLEIDMPPGTRTYWRVPGESGIPAEFDISGSLGVSGLNPLWPYPEVDRTGGYLDYVYFGPTVLPIIASVEGANPQLQARVTLGICSDVCIPAMASFHMPLAFGAADVAARIRLDQAIALTPIQWNGDPDAIGPVRFDSAAGALWVGLTDATIEPDSVIADSGPAGPLFGAPQKSPDGRAVLLPLLGGSDALGLEGLPLHLTFLTPDGAFETTRVIAPAAPGSNG